MKKMRKRVVGIASLSIVLSLCLHVSAASTSQMLAVTRFEQTQTSWCWAAGTKMMTNYYSGIAPSQESIVQLVFGSQANAPASMNQCAYAFMQLTGRGVSRFGTLSGSQVQAQMNAYHPLLLRLAWDNGGGHYVVCSGYDSSYDQLRIIDPAVGCGTRSFYRSSMIKNNYFESGYGKWVEGMNGE